MSDPGARTLGFGKHKGRPIRDVDRKYLVWVTQTITDRPEIPFVKAFLKSSEGQATRSASRRPAPPPRDRGAPVRGASAPGAYGGTENTESTECPDAIYVASPAPRDVLPFVPNSSDELWASLKACGQTDLVAGAPNNTASGPAPPSNVNEELFASLGWPAPYKDRLVTDSDDPRKKVSDLWNGTPVVGDRGGSPFDLTPWRQQLHLLGLPSKLHKKVATLARRQLVWRKDCAYGFEVPYDATIESNDYYFRFLHNPYAFYNVPLAHCDRVAEGSPWNPLIAASDFKDKGTFAHQVYSEVSGMGAKGIGMELTGADMGSRWHGADMGSRWHGADMGSRWHGADMGSRWHGAALGPFESEEEAAEYGVIFDQGLAYLKPWHSAESEVAAFVGKKLGDCPRHLLSFGRAQPDGPIYNIVVTSRRDSLGDVSFLSGPHLTDEKSSDLARAPALTQSLDLARPPTLSPTSTLVSLANPVSQEQLDTLAFAFQHEIALITGKGGTGKSSIIKALVAVFRALRINYWLCAFTGKAVERIVEVVGCRDCTSTIHGLCSKLEDSVKNQQKGDGMLMVRPDFIVIDEASMVSVRLLARLINDARDSALIMLGDPNQLPPLKVGRVFEDLLDTEGVPTAELTHNFRAAAGNDVYIVADAIAGGAKPYLLPYLVDSPREAYGRQFALLVGEHDEVVELVRLRLEEFARGPYRNSDELPLPRVVSPTNLDVVTLNARIGPMVRALVAKERLVPTTDFSAVCRELVEGYVRLATSKHLLDVPEHPSTASKRLLDVPEHPSTASKHLLDVPEHPSTASERPSAASTAEDKWTSAVTSHPNVLVRHSFYDRKTGASNRNEDVDYVVGDPVVFTKNREYHPLVMNGTGGHIIGFAEVVLTKRGSTPPPSKARRSTKAPANPDNSTRHYLMLVQTEVVLDVDPAPPVFGAPQTKKCLNVAVQITPLSDRPGGATVFKKPHVELAYATSVHKAQGSESEDVIFYLATPPSPGFANKRLVYTAITRASERCWVVESCAGLFERACRTEAATQITRLPERVATYL